MTYSLFAVSAVTPSLLLMWYFHSRDVFPEPHRVLWTTFALGVATVVPVVLVTMPLHDAVVGLANPYLNGLCHGFLLAAIPEELFKFLVLYLYCARHREFDEPMDGVVYGVATSLGFATLENVLYVAQGGLEVALTRAISAVPCHAFLGAIMGYYVGQARHRPAQELGLTLKALAIPIVLHGLYDFPLLATQVLVRDAGGRTDDLPGVWLLAVVPLVLGALLIGSVAIVRALRAEQHALVAQGLVAPPPVPPQPPRPRARAWTLTIVGSVLASAGGLFGLGLMVALALGELQGSWFGEHLAAGILGGPSRSPPNGTGP